MSITLQYYNNFCYSMILFQFADIKDQCIVSNCNWSMSVLLFFVFLCLNAIRQVWYIPSSSLFLLYNVPWIQLIFPIICFIKFTYLLWIVFNSVLFSFYFIRTFNIISHSINPCQPLHSSLHPYFRSLNPVLPIIYNIKCMFKKNGLHESENG